MNVLIKPIITEKATNDSELFNRYAFVVNKNANKIEIKNAFEWLKSASLEELDLIFFDPPFFDERIQGLLASLESLKIKKGTLIYFEKSTFDKIDIPDSLKLLKSKSVGDAEGLLLEK